MPSAPNDFNCGIISLTIFSSITVSTRNPSGLGELRNRGIAQRREGLEQIFQLILCDIHFQAHFVAGGVGPPLSKRTSLSIFSRFHASA